MRPEKPLVFHIIYQKSFPNAQEHIVMEILNSTLKKLGINSKVEKSQSRVQEHFNVEIKFSDNNDLKRFFDSIQEDTVVEGQKLYINDTRIWNVSQK